MLLECLRSWVTVNHICVAIFALELLLSPTFRVFSNYGILTNLEIVPALKIRSLLCRNRNTIAGLGIYNVGLKVWHLGAIFFYNSNRSILIIHNDIILTVHFFWLQRLKLKSLHLGAHLVQIFSVIPRGTHLLFGVYFLEQLGCSPDSTAHRIYFVHFIA